MFVLQLFFFSQHEQKMVKSLNVKSGIAINAGERVEKREPLTLLVGMQTGTATLENSVEIP